MVYALAAIVYDLTAIDIIWRLLAPGVFRNPASRRRFLHGSVQETRSSIGPLGGRIYPRRHSSRGTVAKRFLHLSFEGCSRRGTKRQFIAQVTNP
jgi:hypothetical protein